jgi:hypothetical protein
VAQRKNKEVTMPVHFKKEKPNTPAYNKAMREHKALKGTRRSRKQSTRRVIPKEGKEEKFQLAPRGYSAKAAVREAKLDLKSKKLMAEAKLAAKKKIAAEKKRQELVKKRLALMKAVKKKGVKLRTDYTALYRK